ncbi:hypothetical protein [Hymenobacter cellulosilyticus]|uniref:Uncharacterized protein n=1 Tax=Hymenobacter cellulosilyticus TaxID=2932248 RepID=A0A8T9PYN2_9BACT|nr:hypothetical protein [Hymenobacter cellulosilyticus]UOQ70536.1 hypothetical protein MUN79_17650 [Hymenobacter cellulosilyticus]
MRKSTVLVLGATLLLTSVSFTAPKGWEPLLDKNLSKWRTFESYRHQLGYRGQAPTDAQGKVIPPSATTRTRRMSSRW